MLDDREYNNILDNSKCAFHRNLYDSDEYTQ